MSGSAQRQREWFTIPRTDQLQPGGYLLSNPEYWFSHQAGSLQARSLEIEATK